MLTSACTKGRSLKSPNYVKYPLLSWPSVLLELLTFAAHPVFHNVHASSTEAGVTNPRRMSSPAAPKVSSTALFSARVAGLLLRFWSPGKNLCCTNKVRRESEQ